MTLRFTLPPGGDIPPSAAARRIGLSLEAFRVILPDLIKRGFPLSDMTTGNYDLDAIDEWRRRRHPHLYQGRLTPPATARDAKDVVGERVARLRSG